MALKITHTGGAGNLAELQFRVASIRLDESYPIGGEAITPSMFNLTTIEALVPLSSDVPVRYDIANAKLKVFQPGTKGAAVAATLTVDPAGANNSMLFTAKRANA